MKKPKETQHEYLVRALKEYMEFEEATKKWHIYEFHKKILEYIENDRDTNRSRTH